MAVMKNSPNTTERLHGFAKSTILTRAPEAAFARAPEAAFARAPEAAFARAPEAAFARAPEQNKRKVE